MPDPSFRVVAQNQFQIIYGQQTIHFFGTITQLLAMLARIIT